MSSLENGIVKPIAVIKIDKTNNGRSISPRPRVPAWFKEFKTEFDAFVAAQMQFNAKQQELWAKQMQFNAKQEEFNAYVLDVFKRNNLK